MNYAILRTQKLKHLASVRRSLKHAFREQDTPNADAELTPQNIHIGANSADEGMSKVAALLPEKRRSDAVLAIEYLITASPEVMHGKSREQQDAYFADSLNWLKARHGAENVVYAGIHHDETTPHMYAYVVPIDATTGRLNAKKWLGGAKALSQMQTEFAANVGLKHGLERGIEGSKAKHQTVRQFYSQIEKPVKEVRIGAEYLKPRVLKKGLLTSKYETPEQVAERVTNAVQQVYAPAVEKARKTDTERRRAEEMKNTAQGLSRQLKNAQKRLQEHEMHLAPVLELAKLSKAEFVQLIQHAHKRIQEIGQTKAKGQKRDTGRTR
jgi:hypothetical protein